MSRRTVRLLLAVLATVALLGAGCGWGGDERESLEPLVVGVDLQLSGVGGPVDRVLERGLELRVEQVNARGLWGPRPVELRIVDNAGDPARSAENVAALVADRSVSAVVTGGCDRCWAEATGPAMTAGVVVVSLAAYDVLELVEERRWVFRVGPDAADGADVLALELANAQVETVGLLAAEDAYGQSGADELFDAVAVHGIELVTTARLPADGGEQLVGEAVTQVVGWRPELDPFAPPEPAVVGPEAVVVWSSSPRLAGRAAVLLRASDWDGQLWLDTAAAGELVAVGEQAEALAGARMLFPEVLVSGDLIATTPDLAAKAAWVDAYLARYGSYDAQSSFAADAVDVLAVAAQAAGSTGPEALRDALETLDHPGGLSGHVAFSAGNHSGLQPNALVPLVFVGDVWRPAGRTGPL